MKRILSAVLLLTSVSAFADGIFPASVERFIPDQPTPRLISGSLMMTVGYLAVPYVTYVGLSTSGVGWTIVGEQLLENASRAWAPQAADELVELQGEMQRGEVKVLADVKQATVREALVVVESDAQAMADLTAQLPTATHLERLVVGLQVMLAPVK